jgi:DNA invertase Pin-like site-specific DNA recombinase
MASRGERLWMDGYIRVSQVGRRISPGVQRGLIEGWAEANAAPLLEIFEERDRSGRRGPRPLLERVEDGISHGLVVSKVTRFGRSMLAGLATTERIAAAHGRFVAVENGLDTATDTGRLVLHILLSLAEWDSDQIRADWTTRGRRRSSGGVRVRRQPGRLPAHTLRSP